MSEVKITASGAKIITALESLVSEGMGVKISTVPDRRAPMEFPARYSIRGEWNREIIEASFNGGKFAPVKGDGPETIKEVHAFIAEWSGRWSDVVREGDMGEIERLGVEGFVPPADADGPSVADMIMSDPNAVLITMDGPAEVDPVTAALELAEAKITARGTRVADISDAEFWAYAEAAERAKGDAPAPVMDPVAVKAYAALKAGPAVVSAPVVEESAPVAPVKRVSLSGVASGVLLAAAEGRLSFDAVGRVGARVRGGNGETVRVNSRTVNALTREGLAVASTTSRSIDATDAGREWLAAEGVEIIPPVMIESAPPVEAEVPVPVAPSETEVPVPVAPVAAPVVPDHGQTLPTVVSATAEESQEAAGVDAPAPDADPVADIALMAGTMLNTWGAVAGNVFKMTPGARAKASAEIARDYQTLCAMQADADGNGAHLAKLSEDANEIMRNARKMIKNYAAVITGAPKMRNDRMSKGERATVRKAVAPWRTLAQKHADAQTR